MDECKPLPSAMAQSRSCPRRPLPLMWSGRAPGDAPPRTRRRRGASESAAAGGAVAGRREARDAPACKGQPGNARHVIVTQRTWNPRLMS